MEYNAFYHAYQYLGSPAHAKKKLGSPVLKKEILGSPQKIIQYLGLHKKKGMYRRNICENGRSARSFFREDPSTFCVLPYAKMWVWASRVTHSYTGLEACHWVSLCGGPLRNANRGEFPALAPKKSSKKK